MPWVDFIPRCVVFTFHFAGSILALRPELGQPHLLSDLKLLVPGVMGPRGPGPSKKVSAPPQLNSTGIVLEADHPPWQLIKREAKRIILVKLNPSVW